MAATRKLQGEIDRCLKKVTEGVETFEDIWQKVHNATNSNQKEKYEADLKKEIKKLQRLRDQIKSWIASAEIKDKSILMDNRKLIETQMERFKVVERETKTKAYSKEGLGAAQKLDPAQKEREETEHWLKTSIDKLCCGTDSFESEIELILSNKKKKLDKDKQDRIDELKSRLEKHRFHIRKLETLMRMLLNETVEVEQIKNLKDNVEYYIDSNSEPDFNDDDMVEIYDDIAGMEDMELSGAAAVPTADYNEAGGGTPTSVVSGSSPVSSPPPMAATTAAVTMAANLNNHSTDNLNEVDKKAVCRDHPKPVKPTPILAVTTSIPISIIPSTTTTTTTTTNSTNSITAVSVATSHNCVTGSIKSNTTPSKQTTSTTVTTPVKETEPASPVQQQLAATSNNFAAVAASITRATAIGESNPASVITTVSQVQTQITSNTINSVVLTNPISSLVIQNSTSQPEILYNTDPHNQSSTCRSPDITNISEVLSVDIDASQPITNGPTPEKVSDGMTTLKSMAQQVIDQAGLQNSPVILESNKPQNQGKSDAHIPPLLGVAPLGAVPLQKEHQTQFQLMESAFYHMPQLSDSERIRTYLPRSPCSTPSYYNQTPLSHSDTLDFYQRLATETLFFVFYYMEGTKAQYLAARALKKQSWRFHTKYMMWFQRHEEPKIINEEYEQGTYIYFDYEKWGQRKKEGFTFEYKYLEDRDLN